VRSVPTPTIVPEELWRSARSASRQPGVVAVSSTAGRPCAMPHSAISIASPALAVRMTGSTTAAAIARAAVSAKPVSCIDSVYARSGTRANVESAPRG
jgi:hypothetical protein